MPSTRKEIEVRIGSILENNDPRYSKKRVKVMAIKYEYGDHYAVYQAGHRRAKINIETIKQPHEPKHNKGWTVLDPHAFDVA